MVRKQVLQKLNEAIAERKKFKKELTGNSFSKRLKRLIKYKNKYINDVLVNTLSLITHKDVIAETFWGDYQPLPLEEGISGSIYYFGILWNQAELKLTKYIVKNISEDEIFYDVGANYGFYSGLAFHLASEGEVHSFEPNSKSFRYLSQFLGDKQQCHLNEVAISDSTEEKTLYVPQRHSGGATLQEEVTKKLKENIDVSIQKETISSTTLDKYVERDNITPPTFIKLDIEGSELEALKGGVRTLKEYKPRISMEVWGDQRKNFSQESVRYIKNIGYTPFKINSKGDLVNIGNIDYEQLQGTYENYIFKAVNV